MDLILPIGISVAKLLLTNYTNKRPIMKKQVLIICSALLLHGCGGGGSDESTSAPTTQPSEPTTPTVEETSTAELEVSANFDFRTDMDMQVSIANQVPGQGMLNIYYESSYHDTLNDIHYPDYSTRVVSFDPTAIDSVTVQVNKNWTALYAEFVPTYSGGQEQYYKIALNGQNDAAIVFN